MDTEYFAQRIQCSRDDKDDCLYIVQLLLELAVKARDEGLLALDKVLSEQSARYANPFLRKSVQLIVDVGNAQNVETVLSQYLLSSNFIGRQFLSGVVIAEAVSAIHRAEDLDYIFYFLIPSLFGIDFEENVTAVYRRYRDSLSALAPETPANL